jgi:hypothetical protein
LQAAALIVLPLQCHRAAAPLHHGAALADLKHDDNAITGTSESESESGRSLTAMRCEDPRRSFFAMAWSATCYIKKFYADGTVPNTPLENASVEAYTIVPAVRKR